MIKNQAQFNTNELKAIFSESAVIFDEQINCQSVIIDSREVSPNSLFVAIKGENIDAHTKVADAFKNGASVCIVNRKWYDENKINFQNYNFVVVDDTLKALGKLANFHRLRFDLDILAVAGSNGKTTTKEMIAEVLAKKYQILKTYKNFNNQIGVPLMLLSLNEDIEIAVLELGTNYPSEILILSEMVAPTAGIITNIGKEHLEGFIDLDGVEAEETTLFAYLKKSDSIAFVNMDDERLKMYAMVLDNKFTYGTSSENYYNLNSKIEFDSKFNAKILLNDQINEYELNLKAKGLNFVYNSIAAFAVGLHYKVPVEDIIDALSNYTPDNSSQYARMSIEEYNRLLLLNDTYNANPSSTKLALESLKLIPEVSLKVAVLGDMRELGDNSISEHIDILNYASEMADYILLFGDNYKIAKQSIVNEKCQHFNEKLDLFNFLTEIITNNSDKLAVLVKGSRGLKMEEIVEMIKKEYK
jgi:UDP-N-acetylmuramoyl-tripeptide--D-alanyl-D-alanine ligase